jgi:hypothetical protein
LQEHKADLRLREHNPRQDEALYDDAAGDSEDAESELSGEMQRERERESLRCQFVPLSYLFANLQPCRRLNVLGYHLAAMKKPGCSMLALV